MKGDFLKFLAAHPAVALHIISILSSRLREAQNRLRDLAGERVEQRLNLAIEIITGEEEAQLSFLAVVKDLGNPEKPILVVDVGGGSTEFVFGKRNQISHWVSLSVGSVRFTEQFLFSDPVRQEDRDRHGHQDLAGAALLQRHSPRPIRHLEQGEYRQRLGAYRSRGF
jgi:exopolyphosphatase/pppGpp-phosphohydrolase